MKQTFTKLLGGAICALLLVPSVANAEWKDIKVDFTNKNLLTESEKESVTDGTDLAYGLSVDAEGTVSRVATDAGVANLSAKWHSNEHGLKNFSVTIPDVPAGNYKITFGTCAWGGNVTANIGGASSTLFNTNTGACYHNDNVNNIISGYIEVTTTANVVISGGSYVPYFAIEASTYVPNNKTLTFDKGDSGADGVVPTTVVQDIKISDSFTIPTNYTLYKEGYTLTGWNDGSSTYSVGATYTVTGDVTFTPVFTANTVSLNDRTSATTIRWDFRKNQGVPFVGWEGNSGFLVGQADINGTKLDVKMDVDATSGKFNNSNGSWAQVNATTYFTMPICKGAEFSAYTMSTTAKGTFDGVEGGTNDGYNLKYTNTGSGTTMIVGLGAASWYGYIDVTYPAPQTVDVTISDKLFATYYNSELALTVPANLQAATVDGESSGALTLNYRYSEGDVIPAGTPVLLKATAAGTYTLTEKIGDATAAPAGNLLKGSDAAATTTGGAKYYALQNGDNGIGFYWMATGGAAFTSGAHKAYLALGDALAPFFTLEGGTTGINQVNGEGLKIQGEYYNLAGQRVAQPTKGLYIVGGKKVIVK